MATSSEVLFGVSEKILARNRRRRRLKDQIAARTISLGGISVIGAVSLIFFYLLYEVMPLFVPASITSYPSLLSSGLRASFIS